MKLSLSIRRCALLAAAAFTLCTAAPRAHAQANLTFSGGLGSQLHLMLNTPVAYVLTTAPATSSPFFIFQGVGNVFGTFPTVSGTITYTINGGPAQTITNLSSNGTGNDVVATDAFIYGSLSGVSAGDVVTLTSGTLITTGNFAGAPPANGSYQTFISDGFGIKLDAVNGVAVQLVPEPSTWALLGLGGVVLLGLTVKRRLA